MLGLFNGWPFFQMLFSKTQNLTIFKTEFGLFQLQSPGNAVETYSVGLTEVLLRTDSFINLNFGSVCSLVVDFSLKGSFLDRAEGLFLCQPNV